MCNVLTIVCGWFLITCYVCVYTPLDASEVNEHISDRSKIIRHIFLYH